jgi:hypothetical protein
MQRCIYSYFKVKYTWIFLKFTINLCLTLAGSRWRSWLRTCNISREIAGSIPDGVFGTFVWHNPSGRTMDLESTQRLTEMSTRNISWGLYLRRPVRSADWLTHSCPAALQQDCRMSALLLALCLISKYLPLILICCILLRTTKCVKRRFQSLCVSAYSSRNWQRIKKVKVKATINRPKSGVDI